jgi:hypothetical protein
MNIFYVNNDPVKAAQELADEHIRKMQIECAQMCCSVHWQLGSEAPYKKTHVNHPCTRWVLKSKPHYIWVVNHGIEICNEFERRYGKPHATLKVLIWLKNNIPNIPNNGFKQPPKCMPEEYKKESVIDSYKNFYIKDKIEIKNLGWRKLNNKPSWVF